MKGGWTPQEGCPVHSETEAQEQKPAAGRRQDVRTVCKHRCRVSSNESHQGQRVHACPMAACDVDNGCTWLPGMHRETGSGKGQSRGTARFRIATNSAQQIVVVYLCFMVLRRSEGLAPPPHERVCPGAAKTIPL